MTDYLIIKALHIIGFTCWFAGLFYVVRLFIYNVEAREREPAVRDALVEQFNTRQILDPLEVGVDIDAVSRATITVEAATRAIRQGARQLAREFLAEQASNP